ncbi:hypothetical protein AbraIFM66950_005199 [Aspergillus brasiliensis]|nr:hypothetical protein AbraIFM66950_005199 [Aspergillus brasiliensis]
MTVPWACDFAGIVEEVGPKVAKLFQTGDRVTGITHGCNAVRPEDEVRTQDFGRKELGERLHYWSRLYDYWPEFVSEPGTPNAWTATEL